MDAPTPVSDELKGLAFLALLGALGLLALIALAGHEGHIGAGAVAATERTSTVGELPDATPSGLSRTASSATSRPPSTGSGAYARGVEREVDPQMFAFERSYATAEDAGIRQPFAIAYHRGTLVASEGLSVAAGARCEVRVLPVRTSGFNCLVRVTCGDVVLYPDDALNAGYAPCAVEGSEAITAVDDSSSDGDREIDLDVRARSVLVQERVDGRAIAVARVVLES